MAKWIQRGVSLAVLLAYVIYCLYEHRAPGAVLLFLGGFGFLIIWLGNWAMDHFGPTTSLGTEPKEYGCIVAGLGWGFFLTPGAWWLMVGMMFAAS